MSDTPRVRITVRYDKLHAAFERSSGIKSEPFRSHWDVTAAIPIILSPEPIDASHAQFAEQTCETAISIHEREEIERDGIKLLELELIPPSNGEIGAFTYAVRRLQMLLT